MGKLHEVLAVEQDRRKQAMAIIEETLHTFSRKTDHFDGYIKTYTPFEVKEGEQETKIPTESKELVTTVVDKLSYMFDSISNALDTVLSKEETNSGGDVSAELLKFGKFSATSLLALEKFLLPIRPVLKAIPTLDPNREWNDNSSVTANTWKTEGIVQYRTAKKNVPIVMAEATNQHKAQVQMVTQDLQVGMYTTLLTSGRVTPSHKSQILSNFDKLIDAVKVTRAKANQVDAKKLDVAKKLLFSIL